MKRLRLPDRLLPALILFTGLCAGLCPHARAYIISEDGDIGEFLDSLVAPVEFVDTLVPDAGNVFWLDFNDISFYYRQNAADLLRLLPGMYTGYFETYGNRDNVRLLSTRPSQTTILVNGMPTGVNDPLGTDFSMLPLQNIVRIEAVPAGAALAYGTSAPGGAINIVTRGFNAALPFYQFTPLTQETGQEYAGHLHFAQRIYRNLNFYMSSLLKKNTVKEDEYNAIQYNLKLDWHLKDGWEGSFYSYNHTDDKVITEVTLPRDIPTGTDFTITDATAKYRGEYGLTQLTLAGRPYRGNRTELKYYKESASRDFDSKQALLTWSNFGILLSQELKTLIPDHHLTAGLDIHAKSYDMQARTTDPVYYSADPADSLIDLGGLTDYTVSLRAVDRTTVTDRLDVDAALAFNLYGFGSGAQLLPCITFTYRLPGMSRLYAVAERTFANPAIAEQSGVYYPHSRYYMDALGTDLRPEHGYALMAGWRYGNGRKWTSNIGLFNRQVNDAIYWDWPNRSMNSSDTLIYLANRTGAEIRNGMYADIRFKLWGNRVNGGANYTGLFTTGPESYGRTPSLPDSKLSYFLHGRQMLKPDQLMYVGLTVNGEYLSSQHKRIWNGDAGAFPAQSFLDLTLFYNILYFKTYFTIRNIFNRVNTDLGETLDYDADARRFFGFPRPPMDYRFGVSLELGGIYAEEENEEFDYSGVDTDGDGIYDSDDECPETKEDFDGFRDDDGCPDSDNDRDGVPDDRDRCPNTAMSAKVDVDGCAVKKVASRPAGPVRPAVRNVAVLDVHGGGIAPGQLPGLTGTLHKALSDAPGYTVMPLDRMHALLGDTARAALTECSSPACITAAAAPLAVPYTVSLVISKTGRTFTLMLQLVDSATGKPVVELTEKFMGPAAELRAGVESIAKKLIRSDR